MEQKRKNRIAFIESRLHCIIAKDYTWEHIQFTFNYHAAGKLINLRFDNKRRIPWTEHTQKIVARLFELNEYCVNSPCKDVPYHYPQVNELEETLGVTTHVEYAENGEQHNETKIKVIKKPKPIPPL